MASSSSTHHVYLSFHGPDIPKGFLKHLHNQFERKGMTTFKDQGSGPEFVQAIRESRVSIVVLSRNYASSKRCLDELVEIFKCNEASSGQMLVMPIFYKVAPSRIRALMIEMLLGNYFCERTCEGETEEVKKKWSNALVHVGSMRGEYSLDWDDEAAMVEKIATRVSRRLKEMNVNDGV